MICFPSLWFSFVSGGFYFLFWGSSVFSGGCPLVSPKFMTSSLLQGKSFPRLSSASICSMPAFQRVQLTEWLDVYCSSEVPDTYRTPGSIINPTVSARATTNGSKSPEFKYFGLKSDPLRKNHIYYCPIKYSQKHY